MVDPPDLLDLAIRLRADGTEAADRASISRAYYAAFLFLRDLARERDELGRRRSGADHFGVQRFIERREPNLGIALDWLRELRNRADYDLDRGITREDVAVTIDAARRVLRFESPA